MGCIAGCARCILVLFNLVFMLVALAFLAGGVLAIAFADKVQDVVDGLLDGLPSVLDSLGLTSDGGTTAGAIDVAAILKELAIPLLVIGSILFIISIFGCCGACCGLVSCLTIYSVFLGIVILAQIIGVALAFTGMLDDQIRKPLQKSFNNYKGVDYYETDSLLGSFVMMQFECCGLNGPEDWDSQTVWDRTYTVEEDVGGTTRTVTVNLTRPFACCKLSGTFPDVSGLEDQKCVTEVPNETNSWTKGCWNEILAFVDTYEIYIIAGFAAVIIVQFIVLIMTICVIVDKKKEKVQPSA